MPLHIDYRPRTWDEFIGNLSTIESLRSISAREDRPHAFLFHGPSGCGKTTLARILRDSLGCNAIDYREYNAANTRGIDTMREIAANCQFKPLNGPCRVYLLDEAHQITGAAAEALLKTLEDSPGHAYFILCTTAPHKLIPTIRNRCSSYKVSTLRSMEMESLINWVLKDQDVKGFWPEVKKEIIRVAEGCPREALVLLDQVIDMNDPEMAKISVLSGKVGDVAAIKDLCQMLVKDSEPKSKWKKVTEILKGLDDDPESVRRAVLGYFSAVLINGGSVKTAQVMGEFSEPFYNTGKPGLVLACYMAVFG